MAWLLFDRWVRVSLTQEDWEGVLLISVRTKRRSVDETPSVVMIAILDLDGRTVGASLLPGQLASPT